VPVFKGRPRKRKNIQYPTENAAKKKIKVSLENEKNIPANLTSKSQAQPIQTSAKNGRIADCKVVDASDSKPLLAGKEVRGRDTVCHKKREQTIKVSFVIAEKFLAFIYIQ
jgi:hypothetical protein